MLAAPAPPLPTASVRSAASVAQPQDNGPHHAHHTQEEHDMLDKQDEDNLKWRAYRLTLMCIFATFYFGALVMESFDRRIMAGVRDGVIAELFSDSGVAMGRAKIGQSGGRSGGAQEIMNAGEVSSLLIAITSFCANRQGTDAVIKSSWACSLVNLNVADPSVSEWDPVENRMLASSFSDNWKRERKLSDGKVIEAYRRLFKRQFMPEAKAERNRRYSTMRHICNPLFMEEHVAVGDDPVGEIGRKPAGFNNVSQFIANYFDNKSMEGLSEVFEEGPGSNDDEVAEKVTEIFTKQAAMQEKQKNMEEKQEQMLSLLQEIAKHEQNPEKKSDSAVIELQDANNTASAKPVTAPSTPDASPPASPATAGRAVIVARMRTKVADRYGQGCFQTADVSGQVRDFWALFDLDHDLKLNKDDAMKLETKCFSADSEKKLTSTLGEDGVLEFDRFLDFVMDNIMEFRTPSRGFLTLKCRNHHFGLIGLCKPMFIRAQFVIQNVVPRDSGIIENRGHLLLDMTFKSLDGSTNMPASGWYAARIYMDAVGNIGDASWLDLILMLGALLSGLAFVVVDAVFTLIMLPINLVRLASLRFAKGQHVREVSEIIQQRLLALVDARGSRSLYAGTFTLITEELLGLLFVIAIFNCVIQALEPSVLPNGDLDKECVVAFLQSDRSWMKHSLTGVGLFEERGVSMWTYLHKCGKFQHTYQYVSALMNHLFFQVHGMHISHGVALGIALLRTIELLDFVPALQWLHVTARLSVGKIIGFIAVQAFLVFCFAMAMHVQFGDLYVQYSTVQNAFSTIALASVGLTGRATEDVKSFVEWSGSIIYVYIFIFQLLVGVIAMNIFITIIQNAYNSAMNPKKARQMCRDSDAVTVAHLATYFGWQRDDGMLDEAKKDEE